jgi:hypothetical protein
MAAGWRNWLSAWEDYRVDAEEYVALDGERVLILIRYGGRGKTSGLEISRLATKGAFLLRLNDGKVTRMGGYWDRERAFADLGLAPEAGAPDPPGGRASARDPQLRDADACVDVRPGVVVHAPAPGGDSLAGAFALAHAMIGPLRLIVVPSGSTSTGSCS